jgi:hypothetical protein
MHTIQTILMKWAFRNNDYYMIYILYTEYGTGIPNFLLYELPTRNMYTSIEDFNNSNDSKYSVDEYLVKIFILFKSSIYKKLPEWDHKYGYSCISTRSETM